MEMLLPEAVLPVWNLLTYQLLHPSLLITLVLALLATAYRQLLLSASSAAIAAQRVLRLIVQQVGYGSSMRYSTKISVKTTLVALWSIIFSVQYVIKQLFTLQTLRKIRTSTVRLLSIQFMLIRCSPQLFRQLPVICKYLPRMLHRSQRHYWLPHAYLISQKLTIIAPYLHHILPQYQLVLPHCSHLLRDVDALQPHLHWMMPHLPVLLAHYPQLHQAMPYIQPYLSIFLQYKEQLVAELHLIAPHLQQLAPQIPELALRLPGIIAWSDTKRRKSQRTLHKLCRSLDVLAPHIGPLLVEFDVLMPHFDLLYKHSAYLLPHIHKLVAALPLLGPHLHVILPRLPALAPHLTWLLDSHVQSVWRNPARIQRYVDTIDIWTQLLAALTQTQYQLLPLLYPLVNNIELFQQHLPRLRSPSVSPTLTALRSPGNAGQHSPSTGSIKRSGALSPTAVSPVRLSKSTSVSRLEALKRLSGSQSGSELSKLVQQGDELDAALVLQLLAPHAGTLSEKFDQLLPHLPIILPSLYELLPLLSVFVSQIDFFIQQMDKRSITSGEELMQQLLLTRALPGYSQLSSYTPASMKLLLASAAQNGKVRRSNSRLFEYAASATNTLGSVAQYLRTPRSSRPASPASGQRENTFHARGSSEGSSLHNATNVTGSGSPQLSRAATNDPTINRKLFPRTDDPIYNELPSVEDSDAESMQHVDSFNLTDQTAVSDAGSEPTR